MSETVPRILIVDDDARIRLLYQRLLVKAGLTVQEVDSVKAAVRTLETEAFDLVVLDLSMPDADGFDVLRFIHQRRPQQKTLVVSGSVIGPMLDIARHLGATATLEKILAPQLLVEAVQKVLAEGRSEGQGAAPRGG